MRVVSGAKIAFVVSVMGFGLLIASVLLKTKFTPQILTICCGREFAFVGLDLHGWLSLFVTIGLISFVVMMKKNAKSLTEYYVSIAGDRSKAIVPNTIFLLVSFLAVWSAVRHVGSAFIQILQFGWKIPTFISILSDVLSLVLVTFLAFTLVELVNLALISQKKDTIPKLVQTGIIALLIALLQLVPQITNITLYKGWIYILDSGSSVFTIYLLPIVTAVIVASLAILVLVYSRLRNSQ